jgi:hypothetical protein
MNISTATKPTIPQVSTATQCHGKCTSTPAATPSRRPTYDNNPNQPYWCHSYLPPVLHWRSRNGQSRESFPPKSATSAALLFPTPTKNRKSSICAASTTGAQRSFTPSTGPPFTLSLMLSPASPTAVQLPQPPVHDPLG